MQAASAEMLALTKLVKAGSRKVVPAKIEVAAICHAGARWEDAEVVVDGNLVTSRKPDDLPAFCRAAIKVLAEAAIAAR